MLSRVCHEGVAALIKEESRGKTEKGDGERIKSVTGGRRGEGEKRETEFDSLVLA